MESKYRCLFFNKVSWTPYNYRKLQKSESPNMKYLNYIVFRSMVLSFKVIPFRLLYLLSDFLYFLLYDILKYRKSVTYRNIKASFPKKTGNDLKVIVHNYYRHLCDSLVEGIKGFSIKPNILKERYRLINPSMAESFFNKGQDIIVAMSHYGNWEWGSQVGSLYFRHKVNAFYKPLSNKYLDAYLVKLRSQHNMELLSIYEKSFIQHNTGIPRVFFMLSDQNPGSGKNAIWVNFLNQDTACLRGIETYAVLYNIPVIYLRVMKIKRGFYQAQMEELCFEPRRCQKGEITELYMKKLETDILEKPEYWMWSHRRWKRKKLA